MNKEESIKAMYDISDMAEDIYSAINSEDHCLPSHNAVNNALSILIKKIEVLRPHISNIFPDPPTQEDLDNSSSWPNGWRKQ